MNYYNSENNVLKPLSLFSKQVKVERGEGFYSSEKWMNLRKRVFKKYALKCMKCNIKSVELHVDHIKPRSKYPELELEFDNLQILCRCCNMEKSNLNEIDYRPFK